jgi:hypothetical protein
MTRKLPRRWRVTVGGYGYTVTAFERTPGGVLTAYLGASRLVEKMNRATLDGFVRTRASRDPQSPRREALSPPDGPHHRRRP